MSILPKITNRFAQPNRLMYYKYLIGLRKEVLSIPGCRASDIGVSYFPNYCPTIVSILSIVLVIYVLAENAVLIPCLIHIDSKHLFLSL